MDGLLTPDSVVADVPVRYAGYEPANFDHQFRGPVSVREALVASLNIPALKTLEQIGLDTGLARLRAAGLQSLDRPASHYGISLALGSAEVTLLELAEAYAALARLGEHRPLRLCDSDPDGPATRIASPGAAWLLADVLSGPERALQASGHMADTEGPRYAWKTGTSMGHRDAWTVAYGPRHVVAVWIGNPDGRTADGLTGIEAAAPGRPYFPPARLRGETPWVPPAPPTSPAAFTASGRAAGPHCPHTRRLPPWPAAPIPPPAPSIRSAPSPATTAAPQARRRRPSSPPTEGRRSLAPRSRILARLPDWKRAPRRLPSDLSDLRLSDLCLPSPDFLPPPPHPSPPPPPPRPRRRLPIPPRRRLRAAASGIEGCGFGRIRAVLVRQWRAGRPRPVRRERLVAPRPRPPHHRLRRPHRSLPLHRHRSRITHRDRRLPGGQIPCPAMRNILIRKS
ncbi:MAG: penicillin-binding transpeptidase domain-containing protein [Kiritimatiellia bacterium]